MLAVLSLIVIVLVLLLSLKVLIIVLAAVVVVQACMLDVPPRSLLVSFKEITS